MYAVEQLDVCLELMHQQDPRAQEILTALRAATPDLSGAITEDRDGPGWARSQLARLIMSPHLAKRTSIARMLSQAVEAQQAGRLRPVTLRR